MQEHLYVISYDIADAKRWRSVYKTMQGYGEWLQLSVFQCRLHSAKMAELIALLDTIIAHGQDHVVILDLGPADTVKPRVTSLGKAFKPVSKEPLIV